MLQQDWCSTDNSGNIALGSEKSLTVSGVNNSITKHNHNVSPLDSFRNSGNKSVWRDQIFKEQMKIHQILIEELSLNPIKLWKIYVVKISIGWSLHNFNINSLQNKFESQQHIINKNIDVLLISETKIDSSFPSAQFHLEGYATPYRLDRNANGGGILLYIREDVPSKLLNTDLPINWRIFHWSKIKEKEIAPLQLLLS